MPELKKTGPKPKAPWELVSITDVVVWYPDGDKNLKPCPAIVTGVGPSLCLNIVSGDSYNMRIRDGVLHVDDPRCGGEHVREAGGWDFSPLMKRLAALEEIACVCE